MAKWSRWRSSGAWKCVFSRPAFRFRGDWWGRRMGKQSEVFVFRRFGKKNSSTSDENLRNRVNVDPQFLQSFTSSCLVSLCFPFATQGYCTKGGVARLPSADFAFAKASTRLSEKDDHRHLTPVTPRGLLPNHPQTGPDPEPPECRPVATSGGRTHIK